jgi:hypothetical protein
VAASGYVVERGAGMIAEYASSSQGRRGFCRVCGASLYWRSTGEPDSIDLSLGTFDPAWTGIVERELYPEHKPSWLPHR